MFKANYKDLTLKLTDFHYIKDNDYPEEDMTFCLLLLTNGRLTAGEWWSKYDPQKKSSVPGDFVRGLADVVSFKKINAWLPLDEWNLEAALKDKSTDTIWVGDESDNSIELKGFRSIANGEIPQDEQYCFVIKKDGNMSGGRWSDGGPYLKEPGYFEHSSGGSTISVKEVWAWVALEPDKKKPTVWQLFHQKQAEEMKQKKEEKQSEKKIKYTFEDGYNADVYIDKAVRKLNKSYPWVTKEYLDSSYRFAIENKDGEYQYIEYQKKGSGKTATETREVIEAFFGKMNGNDFVEHIVFRNEGYVISKNKVVDTYSVPFYPTDTSGDWHLEHYIFEKHATGDFTVDVQAGDRCAGGSRTFGISRKCFKQPDFDSFLDEYVKIVPGGPFGLFKEDLVDDGQLKAFLGYTPLKPHPEVEVVELEKKPVIGKDEYCSGGKNLPIKTDGRPDNHPDIIERLWKDVKKNLKEIEKYARKVDGAIPGFWGLMSDGNPERSEKLMPWREYYKSGYYFASVEADNNIDKSLPSANWSKAFIPKGRYVVSEEIDHNYDEVFMKYINTIIPEMGYRLSGCVCEYMDAVTGKLRLYFPVGELK